MSKTLPMIQPDTAVLLVVDMQDRLLPAIHEADRCVEASRKMIESARVLGVPMLVTEQYPAGIGHTCSTLCERLRDVEVIEKVRFSACVEAVVAHLGELGRADVIIVGIEAHVCVQQTVLDLLRLGYRPYLCADAVGSRRPIDRDTAIERMRQAGAIITTTESVTFELLGQAGTDQFKRILPIIK